MRRPERIPRIMKFFKKNKKAFNEINNIKKGNYHQIFLDRYEELFAIWYDYPDLRFTQLLINEGIVPDNGNWSREESYFVINKGYMKPEEITLWGVRGKPEEVEKSYKEWVDSKPVLGESVSYIEEWLSPKLKEMSEVDVYAWKYHKWITRQPQPTYVFIEFLETEHIKNILATQPQISDYYRKIFNSVLLNRKENENMVSSK